MSDPVKVLFPLEQDEDGYPPVSTEGLWALPGADGTFVIDNIPFFARVAAGDRVAARRKQGELWYTRTVERSDNSLVRIVLFEDTQPEAVRGELEGLGCITEYDAHHALIAVHVPATVALGKVQTYLAAASDKGLLDYEEAVLRQE